MTEYDHGISRGARYHYGIGIALVSVVPALVLVVLATRAAGGLDGDAVTVALAAITLVIAMLGHVVLRKYPSSVARLRAYTEQIARGEAPERVSLPRRESDLEAIERSMNLIIAQLRAKVEALEVERHMLRERLFKARKMQSLGLMATGAARVFSGLLDTLDRHVGELKLLAAEATPEWTSAMLIEQTVRHGRELVNQLRVVAGERTPERMRIRLSPLVGDTLDLLRRYVLADTRIDYRPADGLPECLGDPTLVQQAATCMVLHAARMGKATTARTIEVVTEAVDLSEEDLAEAVPPEHIRAGRWLSLRVATPAVMLDEVQRSQVLDPFYAIDGNDGDIGLAAVLGIAQAHHGLVTVSSAPDAGATFRLLLPIATP